MTNNFLEKKRLLTALENGRGVGFVINEGSRIIGNPIVMFDTSYNLLAYADGVETDDRLWNEIIAYGTFSHETVDFFNSENFIQTFARSDTVSLMTSDKLKYDRANGKLFDKDGVQLGNICIVACMKPFEDGDFDLIEIFCEILSAELQGSELYERIDRVYRESIISGLIDEKAREDALLSAKAAELLKEMRSHLRLAVIDISGYDRTVTHLAYFRDLFRRLQPEHKYCIHMDNIVAVISTDNPVLIANKDLRGLNEFFMNNNIYAGISSGFHDLTELRKYHREAICALNLGLCGARHRRIFMYDDFRLEHFISSVKGAEANDLYAPVISLIQEYDGANKTSLFRLFFLYLLYGRDKAQTCETLGISQGELERQLKTLEDVFGVDWKNGDMLSNIFLSMKIAYNSQA